MEKILTSDNDLSLDADVGLKIEMELTRQWGCVVERWMVEIKMNWTVEMKLKNTWPEDNY